MIPLHRFPVFLATAALACSAQAADVAPPARPNVVLIFIDDMGYGDIGPFGSTANRTPHLDRMAKEGMKFTSFYAAPVCSVSRAQVMTGCYGQRVSIPGVFPPGSQHGINAAEHTVAELMKAQGYATMCIGKWHLGDQPEFLPTRHGFDHYFGLPYSNDMMKKAKVNGQLVVPLVRDEKVIELLTGDDQDRLTERYTNEATRFIAENKDRPFFLYLPHTAVHVPIHPGEKFRNRSKNGRYGDWVEEVDWSVGEVLDTLRALQIDRKTLVMFSSDNGPWLTHGADGGTAGPLRGGKGTTWEGGVREPTLAWWPGMIAPGSVCEAVAGNIDFLPTFVKLAGGAVPADNKIDGKDLSPLLLGKSKESPHEARYYYAGYKLQAVRSGPWKLAIATQWEGRTKGEEMVPASIDKPRLYNLDADIGERKDVAAEHPEVVERLRALARKMSTELGDGQPGPAVRPAGFVQNAVTLYPTDDQPRKPGARKKKAKGNTVSLAAMKIGDTLSGEDAPRVSGRPLAIGCEVTTSATSGVLLAHGGASVGYTLYLKEGRVVFAVRRTGAEITRITSAEALLGKASIAAHLAADGTMTLSVNGHLAAHGKTDGLLPRQPAEDFCLGHDNQITVDAYDGKPLLQGTIQNLNISANASETKP